VGAAGAEGLQAGFGKILSVFTGRFGAGELRRCLEVIRRAVKWIATKGRPVFPPAAVIFD